MPDDFTLTLAAGKTTTVSYAVTQDDLERIVDSLEGALFVFDSNSQQVLSKLPSLSLVLEAGEEHKTWASIEKILKAALDAGLARDSSFVAVGGGVVCDMTALAASLYMRGCGLVLIPTTLLCMVDASLGGKSAIDFAGGKNLVGSFYPASKVVIAPSTLASLPRHELMCGLGEVIKHAFLTEDRSLYDELMDKRDAVLSADPVSMLPMIDRSLHVKAFYIGRDPEEKKGIRSFLNLGHSFAHALEALDGFKTSHGMAVAWGLSRAAWVSAQLGLCGPDLSQMADKILSSYGYDIARRIGPSDWPAFSSALSKDKKRSAGQVRFVLLEGLGRPVLRTLDEELVRKAVMA